MLEPAEDHAAAGCREMRLRGLTRGGNLQGLDGHVPRRLLRRLGPLRVGRGLGSAIAGRDDEAQPDQPDAGGVTHYVLLSVEHSTGPPVARGLTRRARSRTMAV